MNAEAPNREQLEQEFRAEKMEAIARLAGGVAHDFNNLLTIIGGHAALMRAETPKDDPHQDNLREIVAAVQRATALTRQLLFFGRREASNPVEIDLNDSIRDLDKLLRRLIGDDIALTLKLDPALARIFADQSQIEQVLMTLAVNARDAMPGRGTLTIATSHTTIGPDDARRDAGAAPGEYVVLTVTDDGAGMSEETKSRIFEPFFTTKAPGKGTGLGLATTYTIVQESRGFVRVESAPGAGTTFSVFLPCVGQGSAAAAPALRRGANADQETILVVEDEASLRIVATRMLARQGYTVLDAADPGSAIEIARTHALIDLLLTDFDMPGMDGRELAARIAAIIPGVKVLYMSGYTNSAVEQHGAPPAENLPFIQKPFDISVLAQKVREVLDS